MTHTSSHNENAFDKAAREVERVAEQFQLMLIDFTPRTADSRSQSERENRERKRRLAVYYCDLCKAIA